MNTHALSGIRIADFSWVGAGSFTTKLLADHGADVIKIESSHKVDGLRLAPPFSGGEPGHNRSGYFADRNSSKRSITVNLKSAEGREVARSLIRASDVVVNNFTPGVMDRFGLGWADVRQFKPDIVYLAMSMQGATGPSSAELGYGMTIGALVGLQHLTGLADDEPVGTGTNYPDHIPNPGHAAFAVLAALRHRRRTGEGQYIDLAQTEPTIALLGTALLQAETTGIDPVRNGNHHARHAPHNVYPCTGDDEWVALAVTDDRQWEALADLLGIERRPEWTHETGRKAAEQDLDTAIRDRTIHWEAEQLAERARAAGVAAGKVNNARDLLADPQLAHRDHWIRLRHPEMGSTVYSAPAFRLSKTPGELSRPAPCLGQHTQEVCESVLHLTPEETQRLRDSGALT
ncbi:CoA transferase [Saccharomonospora sp. NPDC046836]|uniref:CaiB/BaiF CoA transferase family protein n=1 Tax=Saccharomonospora sp. NPDC046836 TaxID=3156921 RepID=UPI0033ECF8A9